MWANAGAICFFRRALVKKRLIYMLDQKELDRFGRACEPGCCAYWYESYMFCALQASFRQISRERFVGDINPSPP
jgi:hypothetical protein